jgi:hypothetical protein
VNLCHPSSERTPEISEPQSGWFFAQNWLRVTEGRRTFPDSNVLSGRNFLRTVFQPLGSWLISGCRFATQFALLAATLLIAFGTRAGTTNGLSNAEIQGRQLARQLCELSVENSTNNGILKIRDAKGRRPEIPVKCEIVATATNWQSIYTATDAAGQRVILSVMHQHDGPNTYQLAGGITISGNELMAPFAGSDFWIADLGLEFFHWPEQKVLKKEVKRSRGCTVLESTNPNPATNGYSRVVSWIDNESGCIVQAEACDVNGKLLKEFYPKSFKKVNGQWEPQDMDIRNVQTGSRTRLEFDLNKE